MTVGAGIAQHDLPALVISLLAPVIFLLFGATVSGGGAWVLLILAILGAIAGLGAAGGLMAAVVAWRSDRRLLVGLASVSAVVNAMFLTWAIRALLAVAAHRPG